MPKIICRCCQRELATITNDVISFTDMKTVSIIEINFATGVKEIKCHGCHNWLLIDTENKIEVNHKRKGADILYNQTKK